MIKKPEVTPDGTLIVPATMDASDWMVLNGLAVKKPAKIRVNEHDSAFNVDIIQQLDAMSNTPSVIRARDALLTDPTDAYALNVMTSLAADKATLRLTLVRDANNQVII